MATDEYRYSIWRVVYRCACGNTFQRFHSQDSRPLPGQTMESECCDGRKGLPIRTEEVRDPEWALIAKVYLL